MARVMEERGISPGYPVETAAHVEMKVAVRMIRAREPHAEIVLNNLPCQGIFGCTELLPIVLPAGYSMTVHGPNYRQTFHGGEQW